VPDPASCVRGAPARLGVAVFAVTAVLYALAAAPVPFYTKAEPREALVARAILDGYGVVLPLRDGTEIPSKPPLFHWLAATAATVVRPAELAMRMPSVVLGAAGVAVSAAVAAAASGPAAGVVAAAVLASAFEWLRAATESRVDMTLTFCVLLATLAWRAALAGGDVVRVRAGWIAGAFAVLAKGPVGLVLPVLIAAASEVRTPSRLKRLVDVPAIAVAAVIAGGWYLLAWRVGGHAFLVRHVLQENLGRFLGRGVAGHAHPVWYYVPSLAVGLLPWTLALPSPVRRLWRSRDGLDRFCLAWIAAVFVFYSLSTGKRPAYLLPLYPPLAIVTGRALAAGLERPLPSVLAGVLRGAAVLLAAVGVTVAAVGIRGLEPRIASLLHRHDRAHLPLVVTLVEDNRVAILLVLLLAAGGLCLVGARGRRRAAGLVAVAVAWTVGLAWVGTRPFANALTPRAFAARVDAAVGDAPLCARGWVDFDVRWYLARPLPHCTRRDPQVRFVLHPATASRGRHRRCVAVRLVDDRARTDEPLQLDEVLPDCHRPRRTAGDAS